MNRQQRIVLGGAFLNVVFLLVFPPCEVATLSGAMTFDAFYPVFAIPPQRAISAELLYYALIGIAANAGLAWLVLSRRRFDPGNVVVAMAFLNLAIVLLFPPYERGGAFEGFQFALGGARERRIFVPLLYLEVIFVLINACAFWLALRERSAAEAIDESIEGLLADKQKQEIEERIQAGVEERIREEAKKAGRAAAQAKRSGP